MTTKKKTKEVKDLQVVSKPVPANLEGLRDALFDELNLLRAGKISVARARTTANLSKRLIEAATLEFVFARQIEANSKSDIKRILDGN